MNTEIKNEKLESMQRIAHELQQYRRRRNIRPSEIDQAAYLFESTANLMRLTQSGLESAQRTHTQAVDAAVVRKYPAIKEVSK